MSRHGGRVGRLVVTGLLVGALAGCGSQAKYKPTEVTGASVSTTSLVLGGSDAVRSFTIDPGSATGAWTATVADTFVTLSPASGTGPTVISVTANRNNLAPGSYTTAVTLTTSAGRPRLGVTVVVPSGAVPQLTTTPNSLDFATDQSSLSFTVQNTGVGSLTWSAAELVSWATITPRTGTGTGTVTVTVDRGSLPAGTHTGYVRVTSNGGISTVQLSVQVGAAANTSTADELQVVPTALAFDTTQTFLPLAVKTAGSQVVWTASSSAGWVTPAPVSGAGDGNVVVTIDRSQLPVGLNTATVTIRYSVAGGALTTVAVPVSVMLGATGLAQLAASPASLGFAPADTTKTLTISNIGSGTLNWAAASASSWLTVTPATGAGNATLTIAVNRADPGAAAGYGTVVVVSSGGTASIPVVLGTAVAGSGSAVLSVSATLLDFGDTTTQLPLQVSNLGGGALSWQATVNRPWISLTPPAGNNNVLTQVSIDRTNLPAGTSIGNVSFTSNGGTQTVVVTAHTAGGLTQPQLFVTPLGLDFGTTATSKTFSIVNAGGGTLTWTATPSQAWIHVSAANGSGTTPLTVTIDRTALPAGQQTGTVAVASNGGNATVTIVANGG